MSKRSHEGSPSERYRLDLQVWRGVAVLAVMFAHFGERVPGGFLGVDMFFAISGFVITLSLIDLHQRCISRPTFLTTFWIRRFVRLIPALVLVIATTLILASLTVPPGPELNAQIEMSIWAVFFAGNVGVELLDGGRDYFDAGVDQNWMLHLWSLGVEEQFYLLFPFVFLAILAPQQAERRSNRAIVFVATGMAISFAIALVDDISPAFNLTGFTGQVVDALFGYYSPATRAWQLLVGVLAALITTKRIRKQENWPSLLGALIVIASFWLMPESPSLPGLPTLWFMFGVFLLILYPIPAKATSSIVLRPLLWLGDRSYGAYLWHWPIWIFVTSRVEAVSASALISLALTLGISALSYRFIERPFIQHARRRETSPRRQGATSIKPYSAKEFPLIPRVVVATSALLVGAFALIVLGGPGPQQAYKRLWLEFQSSETANTFNVLESRNDRRLVDWGADSNGIQDLSECRFRVESITQTEKIRLRECERRFGPGTLILGDSHAIDLFGMVASRFDDPFIVGVSRGFCRPHANYEHCHYDGVLDFIKSNQQIFQLVIYEQAGFYLMRDANDAPGSRELFASLDLFEPVEGISVDSENVALTLSYLQDLSLYSSVKWFLPRVEPHMSRELILEKGCTYNFQLRPGQREVFENLDKEIKNRVQFARHQALSVVSQTELIGLHLPGDFMDCQQIYWSDGDHLSAAGERKFGARLPDDFLIP